MNCEKVKKWVKWIVVVLVGIGGWLLRSLVDRRRVQSGGESSGGIERGMGDAEADLREADRINDEYRKESEELRDDSRQFSREVREAKQLIEESSRRAGKGEGKAASALNILRKAKKRTEDCGD